MEIIDKGNLTFEKVGDVYVSEFEVNSDFNLHIEKGGRISLFQRGCSGKYDSINSVPAKELGRMVFDYDFSSLLYPKWVKVVTTSEPSYAFITADGESAEIRSQFKEIEVVSNGVVEVAPDAGYSYLSGVRIKVNVPQEGGGGEKMTFSIDGGEYYAVVGMTWAEWCESDYCPKTEDERYFVSEETIAASYNDGWVGAFGHVADANYQFVKPTDIISNEIEYIRTQY